MRRTRRGICRWCESGSLWITRAAFMKPWTASSNSRRPASTSRSWPRRIPSTPISQLGYLAAKTNTVELASGVFPIYIRTPSLLAMTAAGLDYVSDGRFRLGIGTSGPQVIEGFHGIAFDAPLGRTREIVEICRRCGAGNGCNTPGSTTRSRCRRTAEQVWANRCSSSITLCGNVFR